MEDAFAFLLTDQSGGNMNNSSRLKSTKVFAQIPIWILVPCVFALTSYAWQPANAQSPLSQSSAMGNCNQPMPDPITYVQIPRAPTYANPSKDGCWLFVTVNPA